MSKKVPTPIGSFQAHADVGALVKAMESLYTTWNHGESKQHWPTLQKAAREFAMQYDWPHIVDTYWNPFIDWLWDRFEVKYIQKNLLYDT